jgi:hypothetical protein
VLLWLDALLPLDCMACRVLCWKSCRSLWLWLVLTVLTGQLGQLPAMQVLLLAAVLLCNGLQDGSWCCLRMGEASVSACCCQRFFLGACR